MHQGILILGVSAFVLTAFCAHAQVLEVSEDLAVKQAVRAAQAERASDVTDLQEALAIASPEQKTALVEEYVARDRARAAEIRAQREIPSEPVLVDRSVGIEDANVRAAIQAEDHAVASGVALVEAMMTLSPAEATEAFLEWEQGAERKAMMPAAGEEVSQSLPVLDEWVAAEDASPAEKELAAAHNRMNTRILNYMESSQNLSPQAQTEAFLLLEQQIRADRETIRQSRNSILEPAHETHD